MKWWRCLSNKNKKGWVGKLGSCPNGQANWTNHVSIRLCVNTCLCVSAELWFYFVHFMYYNVPYALIKYVGMWVITKHSKALSFFGNICQIVELKCSASVTEFAFEPFNYYKITYRSTCTPYKSKYQWWYLNQYWPVQVVKYPFFCTVCKFQCITKLSVCVSISVCTQAQLASWSWAIRWGSVKKRQGDRYSSSALLQWSSNTRSPEAALQHCCVSIISVLKGSSHAVWGQSTVKLRQGGKDIWLACNSDECAIKCCYQCLYFMVLRQIYF